MPFPTRSWGTREKGSHARQGRGGSSRPRFRQFDAYSAGRGRSGTAKPIRSRTASGMCSKIRVCSSRILV